MGSGIASPMLEISDWVAGAGPAPYPLAQASQDHLISLTINDSLEKGLPVTISAED